jgi:23S rRNA pseudouridine1911/1915/1917 synthase
MSQDKRKWTVDGDGAAISSELHRSMGVSHRQAKGLIDARCVTVNGEPVAAHGRRLKTGDEVEVCFDPSMTYHELTGPSKTTDTDIRVLWEDKHLVFVDKPAGLLSVPTEHSNDDSLADALAEHYRRQGIKRPRVFIAHRLDRFTTGVMVFAKTPEALNGLRDTFFEHSLNRIYKAILVGELPENSGTLHDKVAERTRRLKMIVVASRTGAPRPKDAKPAVTHYRVMERLPGHTVVELKLETGRRNQIRVQFSERGYPILGDKIYGSTSPLIERQALHAEVLGLRHPVTGEGIMVNSDLPGDMEAALQRLRLLHRVDRAKAGLKGEQGIFKPRRSRESWEDRDGHGKEFSGEGCGGFGGTETPERPGMGKGGRGENGGKARPARPHLDGFRKESYSRGKDRGGRDANGGRDEREGRGWRDGTSSGFKPISGKQHQAADDPNDTRRKPSQGVRGESEGKARLHPDRSQKARYSSGKDRGGSDADGGRDEREGRGWRDGASGGFKPRPSRQPQADGDHGDTHGKPRQYGHAAVTGAPSGEGKRREGHFANPNAPPKKRSAERRSAKLPPQKPKTTKDQKD